MNIEKVAVLGAGAIGAYFIDGLREKLGDNLWVIAEGERKERLEKNGITVNGRALALNVRTPEEATGADLVIVGVKYGALAEAADMLHRMVDAHTIVMSPLNGVASEEILGEAIGMEHMLYSVMKIASERDGNAIKYDPEVTPGIFFGETDGARSARIDAMDALFSDVPIRYHIIDNILQEMWMKFALNISKNLPQAIVGVGLGAYFDSTHLAFMSDALEAEVVRVAAAKGIDISQRPVSTTDACRAFTRDAKFSTLQDLEAGRETEIEAFSGTLMRMGEALGIPTPYNTFAYHTIKCMDEKNAGVIR